MSFVDEAAAQLAQQLFDADKGSVGGPTPPTYAPPAHLLPPRPSAAASPEAAHGLAGAERSPGSASGAAVCDGASVSATVGDNAQDESWRVGAATVGAVDDEVRSLTLAARAPLERAAGRTFERFEPEAVLTQVVAGTNYFVGVRVATEESVWLRIYQHFTGSCRLMGWKVGQPPAAALAFFPESCDVPIDAVLLTLGDPPTPPAWRPEPADGPAAAAAPVLAGQPGWGANANGEVGRNGHDASKTAEPSAEQRTHEGGPAKAVPKEYEAAAARIEAKIRAMQAGTPEQLASAPAGAGPQGGGSGYKSRSLHPELMQIHKRKPIKARPPPSGRPRSLARPPPPPAPPCGQPRSRSTPANLRP